MPGVSDTAVFNIGSPGYTVSFTSSLSNQGVLVQNDIVTFDLSGTSYNLTGLTSPTRALTVGQFSGDTGNLTLLNGTVTTVDLGIGVASSSSGTLNISTGASVNNTGSSYIGENGNAALNIDNGGSLVNSGAFVGDQAGSVGVVTVDGSGSAWTQSNFLRVGSLGSGELTITNGATVENIGTFDTYIGSAAGSTGRVIVDGAGSRLIDADDLSVGQSGEGILIIQNGGSASSNDARVGNGSGSRGEVTVDGPGSTWDLSGSLTVGLSGYGELTIQNGGTVNSAGATIGAIAGSDGSAVTVAGAGSRWNSSSSISVGRVESGSLTIQDGGSVSASYLLLGDDNFSQGTATIGGEGSTLNLTGDLRIGKNLSFGAGTLDVNQGASIQVDNRLLLEFGVLNLNGGSITTGSFDRDAEFNFNDGTLNIDGGTFNNRSWGNLIIDSTDAGANPTLQFLNGASTSYGTVISELRVGDLGSGTFNIESGSSVLSTSGRLGVGAGSSGSATVDGAGSYWAMLGELTVGDAGSGILNVQNGAEIETGAATTSVIGSQSGSDGTVMFDGASRWTTSAALQVGAYGSGALTIQNGSEVSNTGTSSIGQYSSGSGTVTVDGAGSSWNHSDGVHLVGGIIIYRYADLVVGTHGAGELDIQNGAQVDVSSSSGYYGNVVIGSELGSNGTVTVTGPMSSLSTTGVLRVGNSGTGLLSISNGGSVISSAGSIGSTGSGSVIVDGESSSWVSDTLAVNNGSITVQNQGAVEVSDSLIISSSGTVSLSGGLLGAGRIENLSGGIFNFTGGQLSVDEFSGDVANTGGTFAVKLSPAGTLISGDYTQAPDGVLGIDIGGLLPGTEYDVVNISGVATLGGTLDVSLVDIGSGLFTPTVGDSFDILFAESIVGEFDLLNMAVLGNGLGWDVSYLFDDFGMDLVRLSVVNAIPVPAAVWLFATGLMGLAGFAIRNKS